jgi:hypothetical protein
MVRSCRFDCCVLHCLGRLPCRSCAAQFVPHASNDRAGPEPGSVGPRRLMRHSFVHASSAAAGATRNADATQCGK